MGVTMNEIKFRAWDRRFKEMRYEINEAQDDMDILDIFSYYKDDYIFMQYTGLKDKNGVEIYEGDIVQSIINRKKFIIDFKDFSWVLKTFKQKWLSKIWDEKEILTFKWYCDFTKINNKSPIEYLEIIGNIYENPELLEGALRSKKDGKI